MNPTRSGKTSASMLAIFSPRNARPGHAIVGVLDEGYRDDTGYQPEPSHTFESFSPVRGEVRWLAGAVEDQVPDNPGVAQGDRQPLAHDRIVVPCGVANQDDPIRKRRVSPRIIARVGGTRPGGNPGCYEAGERVAARLPGRQELRRSVRPRKAALTRPAQAGVQPGAATTLVEYEQQLVALADHDVVIVRDPREPVHERPGNVVDRIVALEGNTALAANR